MYFIKGIELMDVLSFLRDEELSFDYQFVKYFLHIKLLFESFKVLILDKFGWLSQIIIVII